MAGKPTATIAEPRWMTVWLLWSAPAFGPGRDLNCSCNLAAQNKARQRPASRRCNESLRNSLVRQSARREISFRKKSPIGHGMSDRESHFVAIWKTSARCTSQEPVIYLPPPEEPPAAGGFAAGASLPVELEPRLPSFTLAEGGSIGCAGTGLGPRSRPAVSSLLSLQPTAKVHRTIVAVITRMARIIVEIL